MAAQLKCKQLVASQDKNRRPIYTVNNVHELLDNSDISDLSDDSVSDDDLLEIANPIHSQSSSSDSDIDESVLSSNRRNIWKKTDKFTPVLPVVTDNPHLPNSYMRPVDYFRKYVDSNMYQLISEMTNIYHLQTNGSSLGVTAKEIRTFFGISILMGCYNMKRIRLYWQRTTRIPIIANAMSRNRYFKIRNNIKLVNNLSVSDDDKTADKFWKIRPLLQKIKETCKLIPMEKNVCIDEQMISFTGRCPSRQYVPRKPNPTGLKNFVLAGQSGIVYDLELYQGSKTFENFDLNGKKVGQGVGAVLRLTQDIPEGHSIFCDRFFTTIDLIKHLKDRNLYMTGTISKKYIPVNFSDDSKMKKTGRGASEQFVSDEMAILKWYDNKGVYLCSSQYGKEPTDICKRWSKKDSARVDVERPNIIKQYNVSMGGVDLCDRMVAYNNISSRSKRWPIRAMNHFIDVIISNCWIQHRLESGSNIQSFDLRSAIGCSLINEADDDEDSSNGENVPPNSCNQNTNAIPHIEFRKKFRHLPKAVDMKNAARCRNPGCAHKSRIMCKKCQVFLCLVSSRNCFLQFHM